VYWLDAGPGAEERALEVLASARVRQP
jgi:hypothetical protein